MSRRHALAAALLAALAASGPRLAAACDDGRHAPVVVSVPLPAPLPLPPPWVAAVLPPPRLAAAAPPSAYLGWLEANRAAYRARWGWNPWRMARYASWYAGYRAGIEARLPGPALHAQGGARGRGHGHGHGHDRWDLD
jgi:hypothetical protein